MTPGEAFRAELRKAGLRQADMMRLADVNRTTVWRWCHGHMDVPIYAWTIVRQQQRIRALTAELVK